MGYPGDGEKSYPTAKNLLIFPIRKIPLNIFKSFAVKSFISSPLNSNFQVNYSMQSSFASSVISVVSYFKFQALCTHITYANLTNQCLLNVAFSMTKALNDGSSPKQKFHSLPPSNAISKILLLLLLASLFFTLLFLFQTLQNFN